jgi:hypothetical protein
MSNGGLQSIDHINTVRKLSNVTSFLKCRVFDINVDKLFSEAPWQWLIHYAGIA